MLYETIIPATGHSFTKRNFIFKYFPTQWHYHKEFELTLITNGWGKRFVGDGVDDFKVGDIVLFGENLPHFHMCDKTYYENNDLYCSSEVIQFTRDIFPADMNKNARVFTHFQSIANKQAGNLISKQKNHRRSYGNISPIGKPPRYQHADQTLSNIGSLRK